MGHWDSVGKQENLCVYIPKTTFQKIWKECCNVPLRPEPEVGCKVLKTETMVCYVLFFHVSIRTNLHKIQYLYQYFNFYFHNKKNCVVEQKVKVLQQAPLSLNGCLTIQNLLHGPPFIIYVQYTVRK